MKKISAILAFIFLAGSVLNAGNQLKKAPDYGKYDDQFGKVFSDISLIKGTDELHSLMVLKGGKVIYERYDAAHSRDCRHILWSASKSFTSLAVGFAIQDGLLGLDDKVISFFRREELPAQPSEWLKEMTVRNLLTMSSGFSKDLIGETRGLVSQGPSSETLCSEIKFKPGSIFEYNSMNTYLLSVIVSRKTGRSLDDYLGEKLFKPLGIKDYYWEKSAEGYCCGGWGLFLSTESLARAGQFMLQEGRWNGKQLLDPAYIAEAGASQIVNYQENKLKPAQKANLANDDWRQGYGFQFWRCTHNAYRMAGAHGQWVIVVPEKDAVIVVTSFCSAGQKLMSSIWENIYPLL